MEAVGLSAAPPAIAGRPEAMQALFENHYGWAANIARMVRRDLPPSFELADLMQIALMEHWKRCGLFDASRGVPYRAYAFLAIKGAVLMSCRRRSYTAATHEGLTGEHADARLDPERRLLEREERRNVSGPREYRLHVKVLAALELLPAEDADLVRRVHLEYGDVEELERSAPGTKWRLTKAVGRLRRLALA